MQNRLFDGLDDAGGDGTPLPDQAARDFASDPAQHVVLEASAGTGKTRVLVDRYVRLIRLGIAPRHILAVTFTRKAAAEMRERILEQLRTELSLDVLADIQVTTIDAFCFGLLREFALEAGVDPGFEIADETEMARFATEALDVTMRIARGLVVRDPQVRLLFTRIRATVLQDVLASLLDRRQVALPAVASFVRHKTSARTPEAVARAFVDRIGRILEGRDAFIADGPQALPEFRWAASEAARLVRGGDGIPTDEVPQFRRRLERYFLTRKGEARRRVPGTVKDYPSPASRKRHEAAFLAMAPDIEAAMAQLDQDVDGLLARGLLTVLTIAVRQYERLLEEHAVLDFPAMLDRAVVLLSRQEEFARSRLKLQARYHHLLVDEFQDTSRQQWRLIDLLVAAWGEGEGVADGQTSIFIVGDRKQSIYRFRHAEVGLLDEAARRISALRPGRQVRQAISRNFRAVPELLGFVNVLASSLDEGIVDGPIDPGSRFEYGERDRFPVGSLTPGARRDGRPVLGIVAAASLQASADAVASAIEKFLAEAIVRDRQGPPRPARPDDVAILFRARAGHQVYEDALERRGIRTYVYKGLGFFDAPEVQDLQALLRFLARPDSNLRAAEFLRSRFVRLSDVALAALAPHLAAAVSGLQEPQVELPGADRRLLACVRGSARQWMALADRISPGALIDLVLRDSMYGVELAGLRLNQARENVKKVRALVRRVENRGYTTVGRLAEYFDALRAGDESNAVIDARGCVSLMTIHAAKGLEFPAVFVVNLHAPGRGGQGSVRVIERAVDDQPEVAFRATEGTKLEDNRDSEELRRLLYVAVTRARDALYLAGEVDDDAVLRAPKRSLAGLLPATLRQTFTRAAVTSDDEVMWEQAGQTFAFRVCRPAPPPVAAEADSTSVPPPGAGRLDRGPLVADPPFWHRVTDSAVDGDIEAGRSPDVEGRWEQEPDRALQHGLGRLAGTLVHRLFQLGAAVGPTVSEVTSHLARLARPEELVDVPDRVAFFRQVADRYLAVSTRSDVRQWLASGQPLYEVPFSFSPPGEPDVVVRGSIDCLVAGSDGRFRVIEIKTGTPAPEHGAQIETYLEAVRQLFPGAPVTGELVYPAVSE